MNILKNILIGFVLVIVILFLLTRFVFTPDFLKPIIEKKVEALTGYHLQLKGHLSWHYFPHIGIDADTLSLTLPNKGTLTLQDLRLSLEFLPLLHKTTNPTQLSIHHARYQLAQGGMIQLNEVTVTPHHLSAEFYQGKLEIEGQMNDFNAALTNTALGPLLQDLTGTTYLTGTLSGESHLTGTSVDTLEGDVHATITEGELQHSMIPSLTLFHHITTQSVIHHGIADITTDLSAEHYQAHGTGKTNLNDMTMDMIVNAYYEHNHTAIPIRIQGPLSHLKVQVQLEPVLGKDLSRLANQLGQLLHS